MDRLFDVSDASQPLDSGDDEKQSISAQQDGGAVIRVEAVL